MGEMKTWTVWIPRERQETPRLEGTGDGPIEYVQQEAETLEISGGALIFRNGSEIEAAWGPGMWSTVEPA